MKRRAVLLVALLAGELLAGVGARNAALAARAGAEVQLRAWIRIDQDRRDQQAFLAAYTSPEAVSWRMEQKRKASSRPPEL